MSILIDGMEMPKSCAGCPAYRFGYTLDSDCWNVCAACGKDLNNPFGIGRPDWCPARPVPPHGRLGDLDRLAEKVKDMAKEFPLDSIGAERYRLFAEFIKTAPTIIPASEEGET